MRASSALSISVWRRLSCLISPARASSVSRSPYSPMSCAAVLTPMPGHARHVVGGVADQRLHLDHLVRRHAELLDHLGDADALVLHRVVHDDAVVHELHQVLVGRHDGGGRLRLAGEPRVGRDQVVGLEAGLLQAGDVEGVHRLADQRELRDQIVRRRPAGAPCIRDRNRCGRSSPTCRTPPRDASARSSGFMSLQQLPQHVAEAEHGVDLQAVGLAGQRRQRVVGAEDVARAVDQEDVVALFQRTGDGGGFRRRRLWRRRLWRRIWRREIWIWLAWPECGPSAAANQCSVRGRCESFRRLHGRHRARA